MIKEVDTMPWEGKYPARITALLLRHGPEVLAYTRRFYEVRNVSGELILGVGVALWNFARPPELWVAMAKPYYLNLRESLRETKAALALPASHYPGLVCEVAKDNVTEQHFVRHIGWRPTGRPSLRPNGQDFIQFEVA